MEETKTIDAQSHALVLRIHEIQRRLMDAL